MTWNYILLILLHIQTPSIYYPYPKIQNHHQYHFFVVVQFPHASDLSLSPFLRLAHRVASGSILGRHRKEVVLEESGTYQIVSYQGMLRNSKMLYLEWMKQWHVVLLYETMMHTCARSFEQNIEGICSSYILSCLDWQNLHIHLASSNKLHPWCCLQSNVRTQKPSKAIIGNPQFLWLDGYGCKTCHSKNYGKCNWAPSLFRTPWMSWCPSWSRP